MNKRIRIFHVEDDERTRNLIKKFLNKKLNEIKYFGVSSLEEYKSLIQSKINEEKGNFNDYKNIFISDGKFYVDGNLTEQAYQQVISYLTDLIDKPNIIVLSGEKEIENSDKFTFLRKPFNFDDLLDVILNFK